MPLPPLVDRLLPFLAWRGGASLRHDAVAGLTVALMMIPQSLAYAQLASLPLHVGLYAALAPTLVAALFGSCGQLSTGPVALTSVLTGASLLPFARPDAAEFLSLAILLALLSGLIQLALGVLRAGWLLNLLSRPVLTGFINAAALLIALSQLPTLTGLTMPHSAHFLLDLRDTLRNFDATHLPSVAFGGAALLALMLLRRLLPRLPAVLLVVTAATGVSAATGFSQAGGAVVGAVPAGLPEFALPRFEWSAAVALVPAAFVVALVSFMEAASSAQLIAGRSGQRWDQNQELIGQGLAKLASAASGSMPVSASFSRSALNYAAGARSGLSSVIAGATVLVTLIYLTPLLWHLPKPVLAAVILQAVAGLIDFRALARAWQASRDDGLASTLTFAATLLFSPNIQNGILSGLLLSLALMLYRDMRPRTVLLGLHPDGTYRDLERFGLRHPDAVTVILRFDSPLTFVTAAAFERAVLAATVAQPDVRVVLVSAAGINAIDATGLHVISTLVERLRGTGRHLAFCGLKKQVIDAMERTGLASRLGADAGYRTEQDALRYLQQRAAAAPARPPPITR